MFEGLEVFDTDDDIDADVAADVALDDFEV